MLLKKEKEFICFSSEVLSITNLLQKKKKKEKLMLILNDNLTYLTSVKLARNSKLKSATRELILFKITSGVIYFDKNTK